MKNDSEMKHESIGKQSDILQERQVKEIPGLSKQYDQEFFKKLEVETGIRLENIVYYQARPPSVRILIASSRGRSMHAHAH